MVAGQQYRRHSFAMPLFRPGILGIFQQIIIKAFHICRSFIVQHSGHQPGDGINHYKSRKLASRQYIIADRNIVGHNLFQYPLVNPFIMAAKENDILFLCQFFRHFLVECLPLRGKVDNTRILSVAVPFFRCYPIPYCLITIIDRLCLH